MKRSPINRGSSQLKRTPLKATSSLKATSGLKKGGRMKHSSAKKQIVIDKKIAIYKKIDSEREAYCEGCGRTNVPLSHSHLVAESWNSDLAAVEENIRLHCLDWTDSIGCHTLWENCDRETIEQMNDFEENMELVKKLDNTYYNKLMVQIYGKQ